MIEMILDVDRIAELVKKDLEEQFGDKYVFGPVKGERRIHYGYDETVEYCGVWVGYSGCSEPPDSDITIGISTRIYDDLLEMWRPYLFFTDGQLPMVATDFVPAHKFEERVRTANRGA